MSADLSSDPNIQAAHTEIRNADSPIDWLYLTYAPDGPKDKLVLVADGEAGIDGLKASLASHQSSAIYFGLLRLEGRFLLFTLLPEDAGGVKRARALVHSRAVGAKFSHQASLTISRAEDLTVSTVRNKLRLDSGSANSSLPPSPNPQIGTPNIPGPSPLRSHFPGNSPTPSNGQFSPRRQEYSEAPPPIPAKEGANLARAGTNASTYSNNLSPRIGDGYTMYVPSDSSTAMHPNLLLQRSASPASNPAGLGLGMPVNGHHTTQQYRNHTPVESVSSQNNTTLSPRLASLDFARKEQPALPYEATTDQRNATPPPGRTSFEKSPRLGSTSSRGGSRAASPALSASSRRQPSVAEDYSSRPQDLSLPDSNGDTAPPSARSMEPSTLESMLRPHDGDASPDGIDEPSSSTVQKVDSVPYTAYHAQQRSSTDSDRQAAAEAVAREIERRWQAEQAELRQQTEAEQRRKDEEAYRQQEEARRIEEEEARQAEEARLAREEEERAAEEIAERERERLRLEEEEIAARKRQEVEERLRKEEADRIAAEERARVEEEERKERERLEAIETAKREELENKRRAKEDLRSRLTSGESGKVALTGFVSVQGGASILWRRRYFEMTSSVLKLYKSDKDTSSPVDLVSLPKNVKSVESHSEDLLAIPHSFKLVFKDYDEEPMLFYCDEEDDKELLISGLTLAAGI